MNALPPLQNERAQQKKYIYCPSRNCANIPEINYSYNPLKTEFQYKCECQKNRNFQANLNLQKFLEKSSEIYCSNCNQEIFDNKIYYCSNCKIFLEEKCAKIHEENLKHILLNENIFNFCTEHKSRFYVRCIKCNKSLCQFCNLNEHDIIEESHHSTFLSDLRLKKNDFDKIKSLFEKQKVFFEKIKNINNNLMQVLENDIQIKERIIYNYEKNIYNYNSDMNLKNLYLNNNQKYESILENILINNSQLEQNENKQINCSNYINNYLSTLYYTLMINNEEDINKSIIIELNKKINNINILNVNSNNNIMKIENPLNEGKDKNKNNDSFKQNSNFSIFNSKTFFNSQTSPNFDNNVFQINSLQELKANNKFDNINSSKDNKDKDNIYENKNSNKYSNMDIRAIFSFKNNSQNPNNINNNIRQNSDKFSSKKTSEKNIENISFKEIKSQKNKNKEEIEGIDNNSQNKRNYNINEEINNKNEIIKNDIINNMIILKSGNIAVSKKEVIEIYDLGKLDFSGENTVYGNDMIQKNCHIQTIKIVKKRFVNYIFELSDQTLLCATPSKIYRIKLTNNDLNSEMLGLIKIEKENPTKIISLGNEFLVVLTEINKFCHIKIFKKIEENKNQTTTGSPKENKEKKEENTGLSLNKDIKEDPSFELIKKNVNEDQKLFISIYPIVKKNNSKEYKYEIRGNNYLYEFIATSNYHFNLGKNHVVFFGIKKNNVNEYYVDKIKELEGLSCSIEADSICQINDKYLCIGLQEQNLNDQINGFAFIDVYKREINRIIDTKNERISCLYYNPISKLLFASMEIKINKKESSFKSKIYQLNENKGEKGNKEIDLKEIYHYINNHDDSINSIGQMIIPHLSKENKEKQKKIIIVTSSKDSTLEAVKVEFE